MRMKSVFRVSLNMWLSSLGVFLLTMIYQQWEHNKVGATTSTIVPYLMLATTVIGVISFLLMIISFYGKQLKAFWVTGHASQGNKFKIDNHGKQTLILGGLLVGLIVILMLNYSTESELQSLAKNSKDKKVSTYNFSVMPSVSPIPTINPGKTTLNRNLPTPDPNMVRCQTVAGEKVMTKNACTELYTKIVTCVFRDGSKKILYKDDCKKIQDAEINQTKEYVQQLVDLINQTTKAQIESTNLYLQQSAQQQQQALDSFKATDNPQYSTNLTQPNFASPVPSPSPSCYTGSTIDQAGCLIDPYIPNNL